MLSLAYGDVQQGVRQLHRPESCYSSQGFKIEGPHAGKLEFDGRGLDVQAVCFIFITKLVFD